MNLRQLYYFKELAEQKQFLKAAKNLNISQPSLSNSLKSLENELGCQLINRNGGKVFLTEYGKIFYKTAVSSVSSIEKAKIEIEQQKKLNNNTVSIACYPTLFNSFLLPSIKEYQAEFPSDTKFIFNDALSLNICSDIRSGKFDLGFCSKEPHFTDLKFVPIYQEKLVALVKKDHPLASKSKISIKDLTDQKIVTYSSTSAFGKEISKHLLSKNKKLHVYDIANDDLSLASAVVMNNKVGIATDSVFLNDFNLVKIPISFPKEICTSYLVYNPKQKKNEEVTHLIDFFKNKKI